MSMIRKLMQIVRFLLIITRPISDVMLNVIYRVFSGPKIKLPPIDDKILLSSATELAEKIRKKQFKAADVMKSYIKRIKEVEPLLNACVDQRFEEATKEAAKVDDFLAETSKSEHEIENEFPLLGVPFSCKEMIGVKGLSQTCGIYAYKTRKAEEDGAAPALYRKAGAVPVVVTNVPELCVWHEAANIAFGRSMNPYDNTRSAGGSSGGEAVVLSYAGAAIGIGNDLAGSIRIPCCYCGIYGHKPSQGLISNEGAWPPDPEVDVYISTGPMCRYARDLPLLTNILSEGRILCKQPVNFQKLKIYYMEEFPGIMLKATPDVKSAVRKAVKYFEDSYQNKATVLHFEELRHSWEIWESKILEVGMPPIRSCLADPETSINLFAEFIKSIFRVCEHTLPAIYYSWIEMRQKDSEYRKFLDMFDRLKCKLEEVLEGGAVLLVPTHPEPSPHYLTTIPKLPNIGYTAIFSVLKLPATHIPTGLSDGIPIGIQAVSAENDDHITIAVAMELDKCFGGWISPSKISV